MKKPELSTLYLRNDHRDGGGNEVGELLMNNGTINKLYVDKNEMGTKGAGLLAKALKDSRPQ